MRRVDTKINWEVADSLIASSYPKIKIIKKIIKGLVVCNSWDL